MILDNERMIALPILLHTKNGFLLNSKKLAVKAVSKKKKLFCFVLFGKMDCLATSSAPQAQAKDKEPLKDSTWSNLNSQTSYTVFLATRESE